MNFIFILCFVGIMWSFYNSFFNKLLCLLLLEGFFSLVIFSMYLSSFSFHNLFILFVFLVIDSVFGLTYFIVAMRFSSFTGCLSTTY